MTKIYKRWLVALIAGILSAVGSFAQTPKPDSIRASLLTCSPGQQVYELYGHTGLRMQDFNRNLDLVFNYGVFSFRQPHFILKFVLGECDYCVQAMDYDFFMGEYAERGSSVTEQELNLTPREALLLMFNLMENTRPENRNYRYNFLYNNCTTRVRDQLEACVNGHIAYPDIVRQDSLKGQKTTFRSILHQYTAGSDWAELGDDILLGQEVDTLVSDHASMFAPERLMAYFDGSYIVDNQGAKRPLVKAKKMLLPARQQAVEKAFPLSPAVCFWIAFAVCVAVVVAEQVKKQNFWICDIIIMTLQGIAGLLLAFMFLFSSHPGVSSNWQIWLLNPLPLLCLPWVVKCAIKRRYCHYHIANLGLLTLFMLSWAFMPQDLSVIVLPLALLLFTRPVSYLIIYRRTGVCRGAQKATEKA